MGKYVERASHFSVLAPLPVMIQELWEQRTRIEDMDDLESYGAVMEAQKSEWIYRL